MGVGFFLHRVYVMAPFEGLLKGSVPFGFAKHIDGSSYNRSLNSFGHYSRDSFAGNVHCLLPPGAFDHGSYANSSCRV